MVACEMEGDSINCFRVGLFLTVHRLISTVVKRWLLRSPERGELGKTKRKCPPSGDGGYYKKVVVFRRCVLHVKKHGERLRLFLLCYVRDSSHYWNEKLR